jgi:hypothetical protein
VCNDSSAAAATAAVAAGLAGLDISSGVLDDMAMPVVMSAPPRPFSLGAGAVTAIEELGDSSSSVGHGPSSGSSADGSSSSSSSESGGDGGTIDGAPDS